MEQRMEAFYNVFVPFGFFDVKGKNKKKMAQLMNSKEFMNCFINLYNLATDTFKWNGLPETCNARFLEIVLMMGNACLRFDENEGFQTLGFMSKEFNIYGEPITGSAFGFSGSFKDCSVYIPGSVNSNINTVVCRDNLTGYPLINYIYSYAQRLADTKRAMDVVVNTLKQPFFIQCEETQKETMERILNKANDNEIAILTANPMNPEALQVLQTGANPAILEAFWQHYTNLENEIKKLLGVSNGTNLDKKERLIVDEVNSSNEQTDDNLSIRLRQREKFAEEANKAFGLNISVEVNAAREFNMLDMMKENDAIKQEENKNE